MSLVFPPIGLSLFLIASRQVFVGNVVTFLLGNRIIFLLMPMLSRVLLPLILSFFLVALGQIFDGNIDTFLLGNHTFFVSIVIFFSC